MKDGTRLVRDPDGDNEETGDKTEGGTGGETKTPPKKPQKIDKIFKSRRSGAEYDLSKEMGGLSRKEWEALDSIERRRILQRQSIWQGQNKEEWAANIKGNANNIVPTSNARKKNFQRDIERYASYEESGEEVIVVNSSSPSGGGGETQSNETMPAATASTGGGDDLTEALYEGG